MSTPVYSLDNNLSSGLPLPGGLWDKTVNILSSQTPGLLRALGAGVLGLQGDSDDTSFLVTLVGGGGSLHIAPGMGISSFVDTGHSVPGYVFLQYDATTSILASDLLNQDSNQNFIYAMPRLDGTLYLDSRQSGTVVFTPFDTDDRDGILLAQVTVASGVITHVDVSVRQWSNLDTLRLMLATIQASIDSIEAVIGFPYPLSGMGALDPIKDRLAALESPTGGSPDSPVTQAQITALNDLINSLTARVAILEAASTASGVTTVHTASSNELLWAEFARLAGATVEQQALVAKRLRAAILKPGRCGFGNQLPDGTNLPTFYYGGNIVQDEDNGRFS